LFQGEDLELQHVGGSSRITQEADNVLAIQRRRDPSDRGRERKYLYILKNRYGGRRVESTRLEMIFQQATYVSFGVYSSLTFKVISDLHAR
jgi:hypothetical protein